MEPVSKPYRAHEFATLAGVTVKALHHYERLGLLNPRRTHAGYRLYRLEDLERVEQILALKFLGLPLKQIKKVLDRSTLPLTDALRLQREALEDKRRLVDRAIRAIRNAERQISPMPAADADVLQTLVEVVAMQNDIDVMKKYLTQAAWAKARDYYDRWPSDAWRDLFSDVERSLDDNPSSSHARLLAARWSALIEIDAAGDPALRAGYMKAWFDREHWPSALLERVAEFPIEPIAQFVAEAAWIKFEVKRTGQGSVSPRAPDRVGETRLRLFRDVQAALTEDPAGRKGQQLAARWRAILDVEAGGDAETRSSLMEAWSRRKKWPTGLRRYVASLYAMDPETWEQIADFIEAANEL